jgi:acetylornithine/succinyldiaminopimelate/putrescine aminotransferase
MAKGMGNGFPIGGIYFRPAQLAALQETTLRFTLAGAYAVLDNISQNLEMRNEFHGRD